MSADKNILKEQIAYYRARAGEYEDWFFRRGRYDRGPTANQAWEAEAEQLVVALDEFAPTGRVLELACGTGLFTRHLLRHAGSITAVDASPEVLEINRQQCGEQRIRFVQANLFEWLPKETYDVVFFSFWLSHVPPDRFASFWEKVRSAVAPNGRVFLIDSLYNPTSTAADHQLRGEDAITVTRRLDDGRKYEIVKVFYRPVDLEAKLGTLGWKASMKATTNYFLYGSATYDPSPLSRITAG
jgi:2-polyprenyl-3-methyl-5-hydroxy-6-metoxy-1,4-benzoquinol methylase